MAVPACGGRSDFDDYGELDGTGAAAAAAGTGGRPGGSGGRPSGSGGRPSGGSGAGGASGSGAAASGGFSPGGSAGDSGAAATGGTAAFNGTGGNEGGFGGSFGGSGAFGGIAGFGGTGDGCLGCVANSCPELLSCLFDESCRSGLDCVARRCAGDRGGPQFECALRCFDDDFGAAVAAFDAVACVELECSQSCR